MTTRVDADPRSSCATSRTVAAVCARLAVAACWVRDCTSWAAVVTASRTPDDRVTVVALLALVDPLDWAPTPPKKFANP